MLRSKSYFKLGQRKPTQRKHIYHFREFNKDRINASMEHSTSWQSKTYFQIRLKRDDTMFRNSEPLNLWCVKNRNLWMRMKGYS